MGLALPSAKFGAGPVAWAGRSVATVQPSECAGYNVLATCEKTPIGRFLGIIAVVKLAAATSSLSPLDSIVTSVDVEGEGIPLRWLARVKYSRMSRDIAIQALRAFGGQQMRRMHIRICDGECASVA